MVRQVIYLTTEPVEGREEKVALQYAERWSVKNATTKFLSEQEGGKMNGCSINAARYRVLLPFHLRNAMTVLNWKRLRRAPQMRRILAQSRRGSYGAGHSAVTYTHNGIFGT